MFTAVSPPADSQTQNSSDVLFPNTSSMYENTAFFTYIWQIQKQTETQFIPHEQKYPEKVRLGIKTKAKHEISNPSVSHVCSSTETARTLTVCTSTEARRHQDQLHREIKRRTKKNKQCYLLSETHIVRFSGQESKLIRNNT